MKNQKIISIKVVTTAMVVAILITIAACGGEQEKSQSPKPPSIDIHGASFMGNLDAIHQHIKAGSDLNEKDEYGSCPLSIAVAFGKTEVARALIEAGADMNITNNDGATPLHTAAFFCRTEIVEMLLEKGADKKLKNNFGSTAFESVAGPFDNVKSIYDQISKDLGPLGFKLDYEQIKITRPKIAEMLR